MMLLFASVDMIAFVSWHHIGWAQGTRQWIRSAKGTFLWFRRWCCSWFRMFLCWKLKLINKLFKGFPSSLPQASPQIFFPVCTLFYAALRGSYNSFRCCFHFFRPKWTWKMFSPPSYSPSKVVNGVRETSYWSGAQASSKRDVRLPICNSTTCVSRRYITKHKKPVLL